MDVPILVAIISVSGALLGTVVGGSIVTGGNYFLARRKEKLEFRTACRLISAEFQDAYHTVKFALEKKRWWHPAEELATEAWKQYKNILAPNLTYDAWSDVRLAAQDIKYANLLASAPRPQDKTEEIFLKEMERALTLLMESIERGRAALMPHLV
jgi:hypothetical protein